MTTTFVSITAMTKLRFVAVWPMVLLPLSNPLFQQCEVTVLSEIAMATGAHKAPMGCITVTALRCALAALAMANVVQLMAVPVPGTK